jgi:hypothetical protein
MCDGIDIVGVCNLHHEQWRNPGFEVVVSGWRFKRQLS